MGSSQALCTEWANHDVLAHLVVGYSATLFGSPPQRCDNVDDFDRAYFYMARRLAAQRDPQALVDDFIELTQQARGVGRVFPRRLLLGDHAIHELDISYALGRDSTIPAPVIAAVLDTEVRIPNPFVPASARARGP